MADIEGIVTGKRFLADGWEVASVLTDRPDLVKYANGRLSLGTSAGILLMLGEAK